MEHYEPLARLEQALRDQVLTPAGVEPPRYVITILDPDPHLSRGGARAKRHVWRDVHGEMAMELPIPRDLFTDHDHVVLAIIVGAVNLVLDNKHAYMSSGVVNALAKLGVGTVAVQGGALNKHGGGKAARPVILPDGALRRWIDQADPSLFVFFTAVAAEPAMPKNRPVSTEKPRPRSMDPQTEKRLRSALDDANMECNAAVARADELEQRAAVAVGGTSH